MERDCDDRVEEGVMDGSRWVVVSEGGRPEVKERWLDGAAGKSKKRELDSLLTVFALRLPRSSRCSASDAGQLNSDWIGTTCRSGESWTKTSALRRDSTTATTIKYNVNVQLPYAVRGTRHTKTY